MGDYPRFEVWVGIRFVDDWRNDDKDTRTWEQVVAKLPPGVVDSDGGLIYDDDKIAELVGFKLDCARCSEEKVGCGLKVFRTDWDDGAALFDPRSLTTQIEEAGNLVTESLRRIGIPWPIEVWSVCDYR